MRSVKVEWVVGFRQKQWVSEEVFETLKTFKHTIERSLRSAKVQWVVAFKQKQWVSEEFFQNIIDIQTYNWRKYALCGSTVSGGIQAEAMAFRRSFQNIIYIQTYNWTKYTLCESTMGGGLQAEAMASRRSFQNNIHIQTYKWTKYALCESILSNGLQAQAMSFRRSFLKHYTHSNTHLNKTCLLWKYTEWWASSRSNGFQKKFFKTLYTFNYTIDQKNALRESTLSGGLQAQAMSFRRIFLKHYTHSNIHLNKVCLLWKVHWVVGFKQKQWVSAEFFKTLFIFKHTIEQCMRSVKVLWVVDFKQKQWVAQEFFETLYTCKRTTEQSMRSAEVHWLVGFKQKQWLSGEILPHILHIETSNWTKYALCERTVSVGLQAQAMSFRKNFLKHYTHSYIHLNKVCLLWKYTEWWASSRSNEFQKNFFKTIYTFKHTIEQIMRSAKVQWVVAFKQKQWVSGEVFQNSIHIQTYNWTRYALCKSTLSVGLQAEAMGSRRIFWNIIHMQTYNWTKYALCGSTLGVWLQAEGMVSRRIFSKHFTYSNIQVDKICTLWKNSECWASRTSKGFLKKFFETLYTFKHANEQGMRPVKVLWVVDSSRSNGVAEEFFWNLINMQTYTEQSMRSAEVHWVFGFKQKEWPPEEVFQNNIHIQTNNWSKYALCESTLNGGLQAEAMAFKRSFSKHYKHSNIQLSEVCALWKYTEWWASSRSNGLQKSFSKLIHNQTYNWTEYARLWKYSECWASSTSNG